MSIDSILISNHFVSHDLELHKKHKFRLLNLRRNFSHSLIISFENDRREYFLQPYVSCTFIELFIYLAMVLYWPQWSAMFTI